jgi:pimeloyl-ACP methyl ester carboxylesterase
LSDHQLHVDVHEGAGPPLLLVHGILGGRALWLANLEALRTVATPVVVELFGHGRSPSPSDPAAYRPAAYVSAFERIREQLGADRWYLLGHSLGAALTLQYVLDHSDRVIAHLFTNSASALAGDEWRAAISATVDAEAARVLERGISYLDGARLNPARSHRVVPAVRHALAGDVPLLQPAGVAATMRFTTPSSSLRAAVAHNPRPALLVAGKREKIFVEPTKFVDATMPDATVVRVDAGHSPNAEVPDQFNALAVEFLACHR